MMFENILSAKIPAKIFSTTLRFNSTYLISAKVILRTNAQKLVGEIECQCFQHFSRLNT